jgi:soluble lytic murein transglycosylase-like protein
MTWRFASAVGSVRLGAIGVGLAAVVLLFEGPQRHGVAAVSPPAINDDRSERVWSLRTDGWVLRIDGAEIALPSVAVQVPTVPKLVLRGVKVSPFDHVIKRHAADANFDWQLVAAVIFEESRFQPGSRSPKGAFGLMQVREIAADAVGEYRFKLPEDNIRTGVRYLRHLDEIYADLPERERRRFVLAAYNGGLGHVADARTLADRRGYDPNRWEGGIRETLPLLEEPRYFDTVPLGYAQGRAIVGYVERVLDRHRYYQRLTATATLEEIASLEQPTEQ